MMKKILYISALVISIVLISSCEDVIQVDLPSEEPRLIVDAVLRVDESQEFVPVEIKVTLSNGFFEQPTPVSDIETILIFYGVEEFDLISEATFSNLTELEAGSGIYVPDPNFTMDQRIRTSNVNPDITFWLQIRHQDKLYLAKTKYTPTVPLDNVTIGGDILFDEDETELIVTFSDTEERDDFYIFDFDFGNYLVSEDEFYQGQQFEFSYFYDEDLNAGDEIDISILGADESFYNYMDLIIQQSEGDFGPFETPAVTVRGNIINATDIDNINSFDNVDNEDNFALGYFAVIQEYKETVTVE